MPSELYCPFLPYPVKSLNSKSINLIVLFCFINSPNSNAVLGPSRFPSNSSFSNYLFIIKFLAISIPSFSLIFFLIILMVFKVVFEDIFWDKILIWASIRLRPDIVYSSIVYSFYRLFIKWPNLPFNVPSYYFSSSYLLRSSALFSSSCLALLS